MPSQEDYLDELLHHVGDDEENESGDSVDALPADTMADLEAALGPDGDLDISSLLAFPEEPAMETEQVLDSVAELGITDELLEDAVADLEAALDSEESLDTGEDGFVETELEEAAIKAMGEPALGDPAIGELEEAAIAGPVIEEFEEAAMSELEEAAIEAMGEPALGDPAIGELEEAAVEEPAMEELEEAVIAELEDAAVEAAGESAVGEFAEPSLEEPVIEEFAEPPLEEPVTEEFAEPALEVPAIEEYAEPALEEPVTEESAEPAIEEPTVEKPAAKAPMEFDLNKMVENLDEPSVDDILEEMASQSRNAESEVMPEETASIAGGDSEPDDDDEISLDDLLAQQAGTALSETEEPVLDEGNDDLADLMGESAPDLDAVSSMSEDEIDKLLAAGAQESVEAEDTYEENQAESPDDEDVLSMLDDTDDSELQEIQDMLQKADNNEAVDEEIEALLQEPAEEENLAEKLLAEDDEEKSDQVDAKTQKVQEKEQKRREKAEAKKAAKEAKASAKAAAKEAKAAARAGAAAADAAAVAGTGAALAENKSTDRETGVDDMFDTSVLDSIVSEADQAGMNEGKPVSEEGGIMEDTDLLGGEEDLLAGLGDMVDMDTGTSGGEAQENSGAAQGNDEAGDDDLDFDMGSLFGNDVGAGSLGAHSDAADGAGESQRSDSDFPDFVEQSVIPEESDKGKKKKGLLARFLDFLTEEDEEDEELSSLQLSDENRDVLNQLDNEKTSGKKKKKKGADEEDGKDKKEKAAKPKKEKKPKPEKPKKEKVVEPGPLIPERKLTLKRVMPVILVCLSVGVLIMVFSNASVDYTTRQNARDAYYAGDYHTCFQNLYGKDNLSETEQIMFGTSESILRIQLWMSEYEMFAEEGLEVEALDSLIQTVNNYPELYEYALQWNAGDQVMAGYAVILNVLGDKYGLTEEQALEIAAVRSDREYTRRIVMIVLGGGGSWDASASTSPSQGAEPAPLPDELPEEGELDNNSFIDNQ